MIDGAPRLTDYELARLAVDKAKLCSSTASTKNPPPRAAMVLARDCELLGWSAKAYGGEIVTSSGTQRFEIALNEHAEQALLNRFAGIDLSNAIAFVTLEPCTRRKTGKSCADLLVESGIRTIFIANSDPNPDVGALAWRSFFKHGIEVRDFPAELRNEARRDNVAFFDKFSLSTGETGSAAFNYEQNGGNRTFGSGEKAFRTRWLSCGPGAIYAYTDVVCIAHHCTSFNQVDDPSRWFEDSNYTKRVNAGQIVIFRNSHGYALFCIRDVTVPAEGRNAELQLEYQLRYFRSGTIDPQD